MTRRQYSIPRRWSYIKFPVFLYNDLRDSEKVTFQTVLLQNLLRVIQQNNLLLPNEIAVIAVSGGVDSLALLHMLLSLQPKLNVQLHVATLDHGLRDDSAADAEFVRQTADSWQLPVTVMHVDVPHLANEQRLGIEAAARQARYTFLAETANQNGARRIVTAHQANDQAETVLMHILRGAGTQGLQGMAFVSSVPTAPDLLLIRPLLQTTREELIVYCQENNLQPRQDSSNSDPNFLRNYIRLHALPLLKSVNPQIERTLTRLADIASTEQGFLDAEYAKFVEQYVQRSEGQVQIDRSAFRALHPALQRRGIYVEANHLFQEYVPSYEPLVTALQLVHTHEVGARVPLGGGIQFRVDYDTFIIEIANAPQPEPTDVLLLPHGSESVLNIPGQTRIPGVSWSIRAELGSHHPAAQANVSTRGNETFILRTRKPGDRFAPYGMNGHTQKIKAWMINNKIPHYLRDRVPLLEINGEIAAICLDAQWTIADTFALRKDTQDAVSIFVNYS